MRKRVEISEELRNFINEFVKRDVILGYYAEKFKEWNEKVGEVYIKLRELNAKENGKDVTWILNKDGQAVEACWTGGLSKKEKEKIAAINKKAKDNLVSCFKDERTEIPRPKKRFFNLF